MTPLAAIERFFERLLERPSARLFRARLQPVQLQRRIERAKQLMNESDHSLADVAVGCGFGTQSRLTTTFKRRTGFTPAEYRRGRSRPAAPA